MRRRPRSWWIRGGLLALWAAAVVCCFAGLTSYATTPGVAARSSRTWPADAGVALDPSRPTLLLFAHPHCPCSAATMDELARLLARNDGRATVRVYFYSDPTLPPDWARSGLWERAERLPQVSVEEDPRGELALRFGARTSGQALLYSPQGELLFDGGITPARGHEGDSVGRAALEALLRGEDAPRQAPVFGCALMGPGPGT